jgi:hypothetical protein
MMVIIVGSTVLGLAAAKTNQRILPHGPIVLELSLESTRSLPVIETLKITSLNTIVGDIIYQWVPTNAVLTNPVLKEEFKQGEIIGILLNYTYTYSQTPQDAGGYMEIPGMKENEYLYLGETLCGYFKKDLALYDSQGNLVANVSDIGSFSGGTYIKTKSVVNRTTTSVWNGYCMLASYSWTPGIYTFKASIKELLTGRVDTAETIVNITVGPPPSAPSPISIHPRLMIIGSEELPEGWIVILENLNKTTLEGYGMSVRYFTKPADGVKWEAEVYITQYANVEIATQYFESRLEGLLLSEKYGHCKVVMQEIGDSRFLVDQFERRDPSWSGWDDPVGYASGSGVIFRKDNLIVNIGGTYQFEAIKRGVYVTNEELIELASIQAAKITAVADTGE